METRQAAPAGQAGPSGARVLVVEGSLIPAEIEEVRRRGNGAVSMCVDAEEAWSLAGQGESDTIVLSAAPEDVERLIARARELPEHASIVLKSRGDTNGAAEKDDGARFVVLQCRDLQSALEACSVPGVKHADLATPGEPVSFSQVRTMVARVHHDINNPLSIVSGNAQLLLELARVMELEEDLVQPVRDIEEASRRIAELMQKLGDLSVRLSAQASAAP